MEKVDVVQRIQQQIPNFVFMNIILTDKMINNLINNVVINNVLIINLFKNLQNKIK